MSGPRDMPISIAAVLNKLTSPFTLFPLIRVRFSGSVQ